MCLVLVAGSQAYYKGMYNSQLWINMEMQGMAYYNHTIPLETFVSV